ncbi:MAG: oligosaccharide flippase family protein [Erysipelotrichaceae bacterium]|nr:oligosaccharide flippase family protein [Erysipelotrichaceae bacterium]
MNKENIKSSLLIGSLASSFGIFISKFLGLLYYSPLSAIAGESNMAFYSIVYTYYDLLLQISQAGIPFAIAAMVARYMANNDYKTVLMIRKLGTSIVMALSVGVAFVLLLLTEGLSRQSLGYSAPLTDINNLKAMFNILTISVITVPLLSSTRGYIQGLKRLDIFASSQVLEQLVRVLSILAFSYLFVKIMNFESIWAIFVAIAAAALGAIVAYIFTVRLSKEDAKHVEELAAQQDYDATRTKKELFIEILTLGIPYLFISFLGAAGPLVNTTFFLDYMTKVNGPEIYDSAKLSVGILQSNIAKIANIPSVFAMGFSSGMVPYLSESLENHDNKKINEQITQIMDASLYILIPIVVVFIFFARDIYFIFYGNYNLTLGASLLCVSNIQLFLGCVAPILSSVLMSLKMRKDAIIALIVSFLIKLITFFPLVRLFGAYGMIYSSGLYYLVQIVMYLYYLKKTFGVDIRGTYGNMFMITLSSLAMVIPAIVIHNLIGFDYQSRLIDIGIMGGVGILMVIIYYVVTVHFSIPQKILQMDDVSIKQLISKLKV